MTPPWAARSRIGRLRPTVPAERSEGIRLYQAGDEVGLFELWQSSRRDGSVLWHREQADGSSSKPGDDQVQQATMRYDRSRAFIDLHGHSHRRP